MLVFDQVSFAYSSHEGEVMALRDVSFELTEGEFLGIIGHTGSGKSTLLQLMCGLLRPTSGAVYFKGQDLAGKKLRDKLFRHVGIAFQYPEQQLFAKTVAEDIAFAPRNAGLDPALVDVQVREAMEIVRLSYRQYAERSPFELSGGEMRRVALAGVLAARPELLILDEPTAGLDPKGQRELMGIIHSLHQAATTVVMVSHSMNNIAELADNVLVLKDGGVASYGSVREVFSHPDELRAINLGQPEAVTFATELTELGLPLSGDIFSVESLADAIVRTMPNSAFVEGVRAGAVAEAAAGAERAGAVAEAAAGAVAEAGAERATAGAVAATPESALVDDEVHHGN